MLFMDKTCTDMCALATQPRRSRYAVHRGSGGGGALNPDNYVSCVYMWSRLRSCAVSVVRGGRSAMALNMTAACVPRRQKDKLMVMNF